MALGRFPGPMPLDDDYLPPRPDTNPMPVVPNDLLVTLRQILNLRFVSNYYQWSMTGCSCVDTTPYGCVNDIPRCTWVLSLLLHRHRRSAVATSFAHSIQVICHFAVTASPLAVSTSDKTPPHYESSSGQLYLIAFPIHILHPFLSVNLF
jgi:hypothetical protein